MKSASVFVCSLALLLLGLDRTATNLFDEGEILVGAQHVFWGDLPYRDFWTAYGPGQYWAVGGLFKLFGPYILVERIWDIIVRAALATLAYTMARQLTSRPIALATWLLSLGWLWVVEFYGYPLLPAAFFGLLSAYLLFKHPTGAAGNWALFGAGASVGLASIFRHDIAAYAFVAEAAALLIGPALLGPTTSARLLPRRLSNVSQVGLLLAGALSVSAPVAAYFILKVPYADLVHPLIIYPLTIYVPTRSLPFPSLMEPLLASTLGQSAGSSLALFGKAFAIYCPCIVASISAIFLWRAPRTTPPASNDQVVWFAGWLLTLLVLTFSLKSTVRPHTSHVVHAVIPSFVLAGLVVHHVRAKLSWLVRGVMIAILGIMAYAPLYLAYRDIVEAWSTSSLAAGSANPVRVVKALYWNLLQRGNGPGPAVFFDIDPNQAAAVSFIRTHTTEGDRLFVGNGRHDLVVVNDVLFYFLVQRRPATKYYEFDPGVVTTAAIQAAIIDDISKARVPYVVRRVSRFDAIREPNRSAESSGVVRLDQFLQRDFAFVERFGDYEIGKKRD